MPVPTTTTATTAQGAMPAPLIPAISASAMAEVDRLMLDDLGVEPLQLMESAGFAIADFCRMHLLAGGVPGARILALAGTGGNGGDAMVAARWLAVWGAAPTVVLSKPAPDYAGIAAHQLATVQRMGLPILDPAGGDEQSLPPANLILDGLLGFSARGNPRGQAGTLIEVANAHGAPVLAIDQPSGLDATTGAIGTPCIRAETTLTLALPKTGLGTVHAAAVTGAIWVADIGVPTAILRQAGADLDRPLFATERFLEWTAEGRPLPSSPSVP